MVLHFLVLLTKLKLILLRTSHGCSTSSVVLSTTRVTGSSLPLVFLFILRIPFIRNMRRQYYTDIFNASRFFIFRLSRILLHDDELNQDSPRWVRAIRLFRERTVHNIAQRRQPSTRQSDEDSFHLLSTLAL